MLQGQGGEGGVGTDGAAIDGGAGRSGEGFFHILGTMAALAGEQADAQQRPLMVGQNIVKTGRLVQKGSLHIRKQIHRGQSALMHAGSLCRGGIAQGAVADQHQMIFGQGPGPFLPCRLGPLGKQRHQARIEAERWIQQRRLPPMQAGHGGS